MTPEDKWWTDFEARLLGITGEVLVGNQACIIPRPYHFERWAKFLFFPRSYQFNDKWAVLRVMEIRISEELIDQSSGDWHLHVIAEEAPRQRLAYSSGGFFPFPDPEAV